MPGCDVHKQITEHTLDVLCKKLKVLPDLCELLGYDENRMSKKTPKGTFKGILIDHVCDPDSHDPRHIDYATEIQEYCICDGVEVDI